MNKILQNLQKKTLWLFFVLLQIAFGQNSFSFNGGTYTIDAVAPASATNYRSFTALANDLKNILRGDGGAAQYAVGGNGLQGNVTVNVTAGTYTERFLLTSILGSSATRRVTINGNGAVLQFTPTLGSDAGIIDLNGTDFFTFNNLEVRNLNTILGYCYWIRNGADNNIIKNSKLRCDNISTIPNLGSAYIWMTNGTTSTASGNSGNFNLIDSCDMRSSTGLNHGPYYGIMMYGNTTPAAVDACNNNTVSNCFIRDFYLYGILHSYSYGTRIINNTLTNTGRTSLFTTKYGTYTISGTFIIDNNRIYNLNGNTPQTSTIYPIYVSNGATVTPNITENKVTNNLIFDFGTGTLQCYLYWYTGYSPAVATLDVDHNTIVFDHPSGMTNTSTNVRNIQGSWFRSVRNNILYNNVGGTTTKWLYYDQAGTTTNPHRWTNFNNNCLAFGPSVGTSGVMAYGALDATASAVGDLATFQDMIAASCPRTNINTNPNFASINPASLDLTPRSVAMSNKAIYISSLAKDINFASRSTTRPDIGAIEYYCDVQMSFFDLTFPSPLCSGFTTTIKGRLKNNNSYPITNPTVSYRVNANNSVNYVIPNIIAAGDSINFTFPLTLRLSNPGNVNLALFSPAADEILSNDTLIKTSIVTPAPGGGVLSHNTAASSTYAIYQFSAKPDVTFPAEIMVYNISAPSRVGFTDADYGSGWIVNTTARTVNGINATSLITGNNAAPNTITVNPTKAWEDSTLILSIRVLNLQTGCDTIYTRRIFIAPKAVPNFIVPSPLCERSEIYFENTSTVSSGIVDYEWDFGDGTGIFTEQSPVHEYAAYGTYTITMKAKTNPYNFVTQKTVIVNVTEVPVAKIINSNKCQGQNIVLNNGTVYVGNGAISYNWSFSDGSPDVNKNVATPVNKMFTNAGTYYVTLKATADGCTDQVTKTVYQFAKPVVNFDKFVGECLNDEFTFKNSSTLSSGTFGNSWNFDDAGNIASDLDPYYTFKTAGPKTIKLKVTSEFNCVDSMSKQIVVKQTPTTDFSLPFACDRTPTQFTNLTNLNGETLANYTWNLGQGAPNNATSPIVNWSTLGPRTITLKTMLLNGCSSEMTKNINVGVQPTANFEFEAKCAGAEIPFTNLSTFPNGIIKYTWDFGDNISSNDNAPTHTYTTNVTQTYFVKLKASIEGGCSDSMVKNLTVLPLPSTCDFNITRNYNAGIRNFVFTPIGTSMNGLSYKWVTGDGNTLSSVASGTNYNYKGNLEYCVTMIAKTADGCDCSKTKCIDVSTSINDITKGNFIIYPNPSNGIFNLKHVNTAKNLTVEIYNLLGEKIESFNFQNAEINTIDLRTLNSGIYFVKINDGIQTNTQKINIVK